MNKLNILQQCVSYNDGLNVLKGKNGNRSNSAFSWEWVWCICPLVRHSQWGIKIKPKSITSWHASSSTPLSSWWIGRLAMEGVYTCKSIYKSKTTRIHRLNLAFSPSFSSPSEFSLLLFMVKHLLCLMPALLVRHQTNIYIFWPRESERKEKYIFLNHAFLMILKARCTYVNFNSYNFYKLNMNYIYMYKYIYIYTYIYIWSCHM